MGCRHPAARSEFYSPIVNTTRNRTRPLIWSNASLTFDNGYFSIIGRTPLSALKRSVSSESMELPEGHPWIAFFLPTICITLTLIGSCGTPTTSNFPLPARPLTIPEIDFASGAVAKISRAPPQLPQRGCCVRRARIDVRVRPQLFG